MPEPAACAAEDGSFRPLPVAAAPDSKPGVPDKLRRLGIDHCRSSGSGRVEAGAGCDFGLPTWRIVRYADDFLVLVHGQ